MESSSCCPIRYDCKNSNSTGLDINQVQEDFQRTNNKHYMRNNKRTHRSNGKNKNITNEAKNNHANVIKI